MTTAQSALVPFGLSGSSILAIETPDLLTFSGARAGVLSLDEIRLATHQDADGTARFDLYETYNDYYEGRQRDPRSLSFNSDDATRDRDFTARHNLCAPVVDIQVERLTVEGFHVSDEMGEGSEQTEQIAAQLWRYWQANRMDAKARITHRRTFKFGDAYVLVEWDAERNRPRYCLEDPRQIVPLYDPRSGALAVVYKSWVEIPAGDPIQGLVNYRVRINKYQPGLIEKFVAERGSQSFTYYTEDTYGDGQSDNGLIPWIGRDGSPLPIPIVHFRHVLDDEGEFGRSDLADVLPMQDEFNRRTYATGQAAILDGSRIKYLINMKELVDERTGEKRSPPMGPGALWILYPEDPDKPAQVGTMEPGDPARLQDVADRELKTIAGLTGVPLHLIWPEGSLPSGESLKTAEARLVSKLTDRTITFGNSWEDLQYLTIKLANTFGGEAIPEDLMVTTTWASVETRTALVEEQVLQLRSPDLSWNQRMRERGYTAEEIALIEGEKDDEQEAAPAPPVAVDGTEMTPEGEDAEGQTEQIDAER